ncbi:MAG TPA: hypothetical protein VGB17_17505 [Pyrinomonadaceae bacterium]|jgi:hypothetical protein
MITIRAGQMRAFEKAAVHNFEQRAVEYVQESFPKHFEIIGEEEIANIVREGLKRAEKYGLTTENSLLVYLHLMFMFGSHFDVDQQLSWAGAVLGDESLRDEAQRIYLLNEKAHEYLQAVAGDDGEYLKKALRHLQESSLEQLAPSADEGFLSYMAGELERVYPQKCEYLNEDGMRQLILHGIKSAKKYEISGERGMAVFIALMFMLGSSFDVDRQFRWAAAALRDDGAADEEEKVANLYRAAMDYLEHWVD